MIYESMVRLGQTMNLFALTLTLSPNGKEIPHDPRHLGVPLGASKMIYEPIVRLGQTMNLFALTLTLSANGKK